MLALRMITQTGPAGCMKIHRALNRSSSVASNEQEQQQVERSSTETQPKLSKSAKRRLRRKKLGDSRRRLPSTERESPQLETAPEHRNQARETEEKLDGGDDPSATDLRVYRLVTHEERRTARDFFERSLMAAFLLKCLQRVDFFEVATKDGGR